MNLWVKSVFLLILLEGSLVGWPRELPATPVAVDTGLATGLEIPLLGPQGVAAPYGLPALILTMEPQASVALWSQNSPAAKAEVMGQEILRSE